MATHRVRSGCVALGQGSAGLEKNMGLPLGLMGGVPTPNRVQLCTTRVVVDGTNPRRTAPSTFAQLQALGFYVGHESLKDSD